MLAHRKRLCQRFKKKGGSVRPCMYRVLRDKAVLLQGAGVWILRSGAGAASPKPLSPKPL